MTNVELTGCRFAWSQASSPFFLKGWKKRWAHSNSVDHSQRPSSTGGIVSGPGSTTSAKPPTMHTSPRRKTPIR